MRNFPRRPSTRQALAEIQRQLCRVLENQEIIMSEQSTEQQTIDAAAAQENTEATDLANQDALLAQVVTAIQALQAKGVDVSDLATATASLVQAQGANDTAVQQLQAAANPAPAAPDAPAAS